MSEPNVEIIEKLAALITFTSCFVPTLAWNTIIQTIFKTVLGDAESIVLLLIYRIVFTIIAVIVIILKAKVKTKDVPETTK